MNIFKFHARNHTQYKSAQHCTIFSALILEISVATASPYSPWSEREGGIKGTKATKLTFVKGDRRAKKRRVTSASLIKIKNRGSLVSAIHQFITTQYIYINIHSCTFNLFQFRSRACV